MIEQYEFHPIAGIFPLLSEPEIEELSLDIGKNGMIHPIILFEGMILDGRNRYLACERAKVDKLWVEPFQGTDPVQFAVSVNRLRRHLTASQRAMAAARIATLPHGVRVDRSPDRSTAITNKQAGSIMGVSWVSTSRARIIQRHAPPNIIAAVEAGKLSLNAAYFNVVKRMPLEQQASLGPSDFRKASVRPPRANVKANANGELHWPSCIPQNLKDAKLTKHQLATIKSIERHFKNRREQRILITILEEYWEWLLKERLKIKQLSCSMILS
jgi:hypothetical protein